MNSTYQGARDAQHLFGRPVVRQQTKHKDSLQRSEFSKRSFLVECLRTNGEVCRQQFNLTTVVAHSQFRIWNKLCLTESLTYNKHTYRCVFHSDKVIPTRKRRRRKRMLTLVLERNFHSGMKLSAKRSCFPSTSQSRLSF